MDDTRADPTTTMQAVLRDLEAGDTQAAEAAMRAVTDAELGTLDVPAFWTPFRTAAFGYGQARLVSFFRQYLTSNVGVRLWGTEWLIEQGQTDAARAELHDLIRMDGASLHIVHALYCYARLGRLDLAGEAIGVVAASPQGSVQDQAGIGFEVADFLRAHGLRGELSRHLHRLGPLCEGDLRLTTQLADRYLAIDERSFALDAFGRLPEPAASSPMSRLYRVQLSAEPHRPDRLAAARPLRHETTTDWEFWLKLSYLAESLDDLPLALEAAQKAVANGPADPVWLQIRLAQVLAATGQPRPAIAAIEALLPNDTAMRFSAQTLADAAVTCARPDLALAVCERWRALRPDDVQARVMECVYSRAAGNDAARYDAASRAMDSLRAGHPFTRQQFGMLIDATGGIRGEWDTELAEAAVRAYPGDAEFAALVKPNSFATRIRGPVDAPAPTPRRKGGWLSWLGL